MAKQKKKPTGKVEVQTAKVYVKATFNNTLVTVADQEGNTLVWGSAGRAGFRGTRKATPYASTSTVEQVLRRARDEFSVKSADVFIKGPGPGRDAALRAIKSAGIRMNMIADVTPVPYNGPRAKKKRRT